MSKGPYYRRKPRVCDVCGKGYQRANRIRLWTVRNEGHRDGWKKVDERVCNHCLNEAHALRAAATFGIRLVGTRRRSVA